MTKIQALANPKQSNIRMIVLVGLSVLALVVSMYVYFVGRIVFDVVGRRTAEASIKSYKSSISSLAVNYLDKVKSLDITQAAAVGLTESRDTLYASRPAAAATVGMAHEL